MLIIGVIAALAILAASLVALLANVQANTADTRQHVKSFTVTEAGLDAGMALLSQQWPMSETSTTTFDAAAFRDRFSLAEFPDPASGQFITVEWYDNQEPIDTDITWDQGRPDEPDNPDGIMWMVAQADVGKRSTRVISEVERTWFTMSLPRGIPLWAGGNLMSNGGGNNPKIDDRGPATLGYHDDGPGRRLHRGVRRLRHGHHPEDGRRDRPSRRGLPAGAGRRAGLRPRRRTAATSPRWHRPRRARPTRSGARPAA